MIPSKLSYLKKKIFFTYLKNCYWEDLILYRHCIDQIIIQCIPEDEIRPILEQSYSFKCGGHVGENKTEAKVLQAGFYWPSPFKDTHAFVMTYDKC